jgi:DNA processing protein
MRVCEQCASRGALLASLAPAIERLRLDRWELIGLLPANEARLLDAVGARTTRLVRTRHNGRSVRAESQALRTQGARSASDARSARSSPQAGVCRHDPRYPARLAELECAPAALHIAAEQPGLLLDLLAHPVVAIVGSRESTYYARDTATALARDLAGAGMTVIGGLAEGIETAAQHGALGAGGKTIAVMASGPDVAYPIQSDRLHARVRERGAAVSELPFGFRPPQPWCFLARNRIIAALADAVIVVEAGASAGTLFTAELACRLGREVGVVPGRTSDPCARGSNALLRDGAQVVLDAQDALGLVGAGLTGPPRCVRSLGR